MASEITERLIAEPEEETVRGVDLSVFLTCAVCMDRLREPRTLPCLHTFCTECLTQHAEHSRVDITLPDTAETVTLPRQTFRCPTCREITELPLGGVPGFRKDFRMEQVKEMLKIVRHIDGEDVKVPREGVQSTVCGVCAGSGPAMNEDRDTESETFYHCSDCQKTLCFLCAEVHRELSVFASHSLTPETPVTTSAETDTEETLQDSPVRCLIHDEDTAEYYCQQCARLVCTTCVISDHSEHAVVSKAAALRDAVRELSFYHKTLAARKTHFQTLLALVTTNADRIRTARDRLSTQIRAESQQLVDEIRLQERKLIREVEERHLEESVRLAETGHHVETTLSRMVKQREATGALLATDLSATQLERCSRTIRESSRIVEDSILFDCEPSFLSMSFEGNSRKIKLGKLSVFTRGATSMTSSRLTDELPSSVRRQLFPLSSQLLRERTNNDSGISSPQEVPSPRVGRCFVVSPLGGASGASASLLVRLGQQGRGGGEFSTPRDACFVPGRSKFVVCDTDNERLQVFDSRGLLMRVIGQGRIRPWGVTCTSRGEYVVADNSGRCVKIFAADGRQKCSIGSFLCPCAVAVTSLDQIVVTDFFSTCACVMQPSGELLRQIRYRSSSDGHACGPSRLAVTPNDDVIISDVSNASVKAYNIRGDILWSVADCSILPAPQGLCVTSSGLVLVADSVRHCVIQIGARGEILGAVRCLDSNMREPTGLAVTTSSSQSDDVDASVASKMTMCVTLAKTNEVRLYEIRLD